MSLGTTGLRDWVIQRVSAVFLAIFLLSLTYYWVTHPNLEAAQWQLFFQMQWVKISVILALLSLVLHAWIGIWTIVTDYIHLYCIRIFVLSLVALFLTGNFIWGLFIFWG